MRYRPFSRTDGNNRNPRPGGKKGTVCRTRDASIDRFFSCDGPNRFRGGLNNSLFPGRLRPGSILKKIQLEAQPAFARSIRERLDAAVIEIAAAIEHDLGDAVLHGTLGQQLADGLGRIDVRPGLAAVAHRLFERRSGRKRLALLIVDDLGIDVLRRAEHRQPRAAVGNRLEDATYTTLAPFGRWSPASVGVPFVEAYLRPGH